MTAIEVIDAVTAIGGSLAIRGDRLLLSGDKGRITDALRESIQANKPELLSLLCPHLPGCPHSDADLVDEFIKTGKLRVEYKGGVVWLVASREHAARVHDGTVYVVEEWKHLADLPPDQIRTLHELRTLGGPGGSIEIKEDRK